MGMPIAIKTTEGICFAFPDTCLTPTPAGPVVPVPYPNIGELGQAVMVSTRVKINGKPVILQGSEIPMSSGDEAGSLGGVLSGKIKGRVTFITSSQRVRIEGRGVVRLGDITMQNDSNAVGTVLNGSPGVMGG